MVGSWKTTMRVAVGILLLCAWVTAAAAAPTMRVSFETVAEGTASGVLTPTQEVVRTDAAWRALWARHRAGVPGARVRPEVDFSRFMVIAVFGGRGPAGSRIKIESIVRQDSRLVVTVDAPGHAGRPDLADTTPYHIVRLRRINLPIVFAVVAPRMDPIRPPIELDKP